MLGRMLIIVAYSIAIHACYLGSKVAVSLYALHLSASQTAIGLYISKRSWPWPGLRPAAVDDDRV